MGMSEEMILDRIRYVAGLPDRQDLASAVETMLNAAKVYEPRRCLLTACSTEAEEEARWRFMRGIKGSAARSIDIAQRVVGERLTKAFGVKADWQAIAKINRCVD